MEELLKILAVVIGTLDTVEVRGEENMDALLGSIKALKYVVQQGQKEAAGHGENKDGQG